MFHSFFRFLFLGIVGIYLSTSSILTGAPLEYLEPSGVAATEGIPSNLVNKSVCVISGEYCDSVLDLVLVGPEPLVIQRHYSNHAQGNLGKSWSFNHCDKLIVGQAAYDESPVWIIGLSQPSGAQLDYIYPQSDAAIKLKHLQFQMLVPKGLTNSANSISGKTNLKNQHVHFYPEEKKVVVVSGSGDRRTFTKCGRSEDGWNVCSQTLEEKVNGSLYRYKKNKKNESGLPRILCESRKDGLRYSSVKFKGHSKGKLLTLEGSDGKKINYHFQTHKFKRVDNKSFLDENTSFITQKYLTEVDHPYAPQERYEYEKCSISKELQLVCKRRPEGRFIQTSYYHLGINPVGGQAGHIAIEKKDDFRLDRVKKLQAPVGHDKTPITTLRLSLQC